MTVLWIAQRELRAVFATAMGWMVLTAFLLITGIFWVFQVEMFVAESSNLIHNPYAAIQLNLTDHLLLPFFGNCTVILLMVTPALSMRSFAEEFKQHSMELLLTSPVSTAQIVLGKYLGVLGTVLVLLAATLHIPIGLSIWGSPDPGMLLGGYLGLFLLGAAVGAIGLWFSASTADQLVALVLTFGAALALYVLGFNTVDPTALQTRLSLSTHLADPLRGQLRLSDLAYFGGLIGFCLVATHQRLESLRWR